MDVTAEHEAPRRLSGSESEAVTVAFGDVAHDVFGIARVGLSVGEDGGAVASGLGLLFSGGEPVSVRADGGVAVGSAGWGGAAAAGVTTEVVEPLRSWRVAFDDGDGSGFSLSLEARSEPAALDRGDDAAKLGGMEGYEQLVSVSGAATVRGTAVPVSCLGQRGHSWGAPDWDKLSLARTVGVWLDGGVGLTLTALRPSKTRDHEREVLAGYLFASADGLAAPVRISEPRLSTTYDEEGCQRRAGLELFVGAEDDYPHRAAGEVLYGTTLDLGRLRLDTAFFEWRMEGRSGVGRYDLLRRV